MQYTYIITDGVNFKLGKSLDPEKRLSQLRTANLNCKLIAYGIGISEKDLHTYFFNSKIKLEWFKLTKAQVFKAVDLIRGDDKAINYFKLLDVSYTEKPVRVSKKDDYSWNLSTEEILTSKEGLKKSIDRNRSYVIKFGMHKGKKLTDMNSLEELSYVAWLTNEMSKSMTPTSRKKDRKYKAFVWWLKEVKKNTNGLVYVKREKRCIGWASVGKPAYAYEYVYTIAKTTKQGEFLRRAPKTISVTSSRVAY